jgi:hypothetical protein
MAQCRTLIPDENVVGNISGTSTRMADCFGSGAAN